MNNMMLIKSEWNGKETFKMIPINLDSPFVECIYDANANVLAIVGKTIKQSFHMLRKVDDNGDIIPRKIRTEGANPFKEERKLIETFQEYYVTDTEDIKEIVKMFASNSDTFDFSKYLRQGLEAVPQSEVPTS